MQTNSDDGQDFIYIGRDITDRERTQQRLMAQYTIARILSEATTIAQATAKILPALCQVLEWDLVELWLAEENQETDATTPLRVQRCVEAWSKSSLPLREFMAIAQKTTLAVGLGLPGRVWITGQPQWVTTADALDILRSPLAAKAGLRVACGFPVQSSGEVLGVMTFFSRELKEPAQDLLQTLTVIGSQLGQFIQRKRIEAALSKEQEQTERLLLNVLPKPIAKRLKQSQETIAENFAEATVLFADLVNFTQLASSLSPIELVNLLNQIFSTFDRLSEQYGLEKIKTIGDAYMVVGGVPKQRADHAQAIAAMALDMQTELAHFNAQFNAHSSATNDCALTMRIGIHSGPVIAGVIGIKKFIYDLWGDTVNIASRMESQGVAGRIQVTAATYSALQNQFAFEYRGSIPIKGKGTMETYFLVGKTVCGLAL
ncbi:MAG: GAF domain-containing protein [Stenomitos rutilans HA7619-LM2]|nr:GAF domain-containing protein [Stenomitos rutilans HA7619-LM2]